MSRYFDDWYDRLPKKLKHKWFHDCIEDFDEIEDDPNWVELDEFPGYFISREGYVCSTLKKGLHELVPWHNNYGHLYVQLRDCYGRKRKMLVHRLVAMAFLDNPNNLPIVRHMDDDPTNNDAYNLAWGTAKDNVQDCIDHGRMFQIPVYCYELDKVFKSCAEAADYFGVTRGAITTCCRDKTHSLKTGHHICYLKDKDERMEHLNKWIKKTGNFKPVKAINIYTGEELIFDSRIEAAEYLGVSDTGIVNVIAGRLTHTGDWTFENVGEEYYE